jgi:tripartite-type tricarboxylate transporter receptor subunit TctC
VHQIDAGHHFEQLTENMESSNAARRHVDLNKEINAGLADPKIKARLADLGGTPLVGSPADFGKLIADDTEKWARVIRAANIKAE